MNKVKTLDDLKKMRESLRASLDLREKSNTPDQLVQIKVSMATCGIAAGAKEIMSYFIEVLDRQKIDALVTQTGCMGYCFFHADPKTHEEIHAFSRDHLMSLLCSWSYSII